MTMIGKLCPGCHGICDGLPPGSGPEYAAQQISFKADALDDLRAMRALAEGQAEMRGDVTDITTVDHGNAYSLYFRNPEENRIEIYIDTPWHIAQPHHEKLDLGQSDADIMTATEQRIRTDPTFLPVEDYTRQQRENLAATGGGAEG